MSATDRRASARHPFPTSATVITPEKSIPVMVVDIGPGGIRIQCPEPVLPNTDVALQLATRDETLLSGTVLWTLHLGERNNNRLYEIGIAADAFILRDQEAIGFANRETIVLEIVSRLQTKPVS